MILGITGHRPSPYLGGYTYPNPTYLKVRKAIKSKFEELKPQKIISGMAQGTDQWAAEIAVEMGIPFIAAIPCDGQDSTWPDKSKEHYHQLLDKADSSVVVCPGPYEASKMHKRDKWIVDNSDELLGVWNSQRYGGTFATIRHAEKSIAKGRVYKIHIINPMEL